MAKRFHFEIITPERPRYNGDIEAVTVPGSEGQMGLLAEHAAILALTEPGVLTVRMPGKEMRMAVGGGFVKMSNNRCVCLVDFAETADEINAEKARAERIAVERELAHPMALEQREPLRLRLKEQLARLEVAGAK